MVGDVKFQGGHGTNLFDGTRFNPYNANATADADPAKRWAGQYPSLWVTNGGGGTFSNVWSPSTYAYSGIYVSDTQTPGHVYQASVEHHVRSRDQPQPRGNWEFLAPQTEEEAGEGEDTVSLEIRDSHDILLANYHAYRVTRTRKPAPAAVKIYNSHDIRFRNVAVNGESGWGTCDENGCATFTAPDQVSVRERHPGRHQRAGSARAAVRGAGPAGRRRRSRPRLPRAKVEKLATASIRWAAAPWTRPGRSTSPTASTSASTAGRPRASCRSCATTPWTRSTWRSMLGQPAGAVVGRPQRLGLQLQAGQSRHRGHGDRRDPGGRPSGAATVLPVNWWNNGEFKDQLDPETYQFTTLAEMFARDMALPSQGIRLARRQPDLPAYRVFQQGPADYRGLRFSDSLDTYGFTTAKPGQRVFVANSSENKTYSGLVGSTGRSRT
jgi:hypothetical protein